MEKSKPYILIGPDHGATAARILMAQIKDLPIIVIDDKPKLIEFPKLPDVVKPFPWKK